MQTQKHSLLESITNTAIGFGVSLMIQLIIYPVLSIPVSIGQNLLITTIFTAVSIARGYVVRRLFNKIKSKL